MSPHDPLGSERRRLREPAGPDERLIDAIVYYGLAQVLILTVLMLWFVFQSTVHRDSHVIGSIVVLVLLPTLIGLRRRELIGDREWPRIETVTLGIGGGYRLLLGRAVFLSAVVGLGTYGAGVAGMVADGPVLPAVVAAGLVAGCVAVFPAVSGTDWRARRGRFALYAAALVGGLYFGAPFDASVGFHSAVVLYPTLVALGVLDLAIGGGAGTGR
ncbi:hypothetical protein ACFO5R_01925 [Halosolutus amylolyticus]|uniref:DUF8215 domain-containing protein n=1 Tax=Halosolutus amylolyticus TaxID=2932267 RepID=A0ABD5PK22_9EURY|nr:hypothetical protein [Halosolutus amylolyticus]